MYQPEQAKIGPTGATFVSQLTQVVEEPAGDRVKGGRFELEWGAPAPLRQRFLGGPRDRRTAAGRSNGSSCAAATEAPPEVLPRH